MGIKEFTVGLLFGWATTDIMENLGLKVKKGSNYDGLFKMLDQARFQFVPRGVNEVIGELTQRNKILKNVIVEPHLALYILGQVMFFLNKLPSNN